MTVHDRIPGHNPRAVIDLVNARSRAAGPPRDGRRLGVVVEGGGMRGVYTSGALLALHLISRPEVFDDLFGCSGGAVNGAHFLSGVGDTKVSTYYRWLAGNKFINPWRFRQMVDIDYFIDEVLGNSEKMEVEKVARARTELWISALNVRTAEVELHNPRREGIALLTMLKASVAVPVFYGRPIAVDAESYLDAGFVQPFPLSAALATDCTDLLVLTARPAGYRTPPRRWWQRKLFDWRCAGANGRLRDLYRRSAESQNKERRLADGTDPCGSVNIATLAPTEVRVDVNSTDANLLREETIRMCRTVLRVFGASDAGLDQLIVAGIV